MLDTLPFREVWAVDFEYLAPDGDRPDPVCMVARELRSGRLLRLWRDELPTRPPFPVGDDVLFVAYMASAELGCFRVLGWPAPARVLDLYVEFRARTNGTKVPMGRGLLAALAFHGLSSISKGEKDAGRALVLRGGPWSTAERAATLDYCQTDVDVLGPLLDQMLPAIQRDRQGLGQALLRGRSMVAVAAMEHAGVPVDTVTLERLRGRWGEIKLDLIREVDRDYGVYDGAVFKKDRFAKWLVNEGIPWPLTETGTPRLDQDSFRDMAKLCPAVSALRELRHALSDLRLERLAVGRDGRNRTGLMPFGATSGRHTPGSTRFIFGPAVWLRGLIQPPPGRALAYVDWSAQEVAIAGALSGDEKLIAAVGSGDPYLAFGRMAGLVPEHATKASHGQLRDQLKACVLGANYGMGPHTLAYRIGASTGEAERLLAALAKTFPRFAHWAEDTVDRGLLLGEVRSVYGWPLRVGRDTRATTLRNFPMQANGAEMLRIACCLATEAGVRVCAPVHDAVLVEAPIADIEGTVELTRQAMGEASRAVLGGLEIGTDVVTVAWPGRYADARGQTMWARTMSLLGRVAA